MSTAIRPVTIQSLAGQGYRQQIQVGAHTFFADVTPDLGGQDTAPSPHEYLLGALGACTAMTLQMYAERKNWDLQGVSVRVDESNTTPAGQTKAIPLINKTIDVRGNLDADQLAALKSVAEKCPVNKLITGEKQVTSALNLVV